MRAARIALALIAVGLVPAAPAHADVTIGSALPPPSGGFEACGGGCTYSNTVIPSRQTVAPSRGIITRWRIRSGAPVPVRFVVLHRPAGPTGPAELAGRSAEVTPALNDVSTFDTRIPIFPGDYIGIELAPNAQAEYFAQVAGTSRDFWTPALAPDVSAAPTNTGDEAEVLVNADIEPDVDGDGLGDSSQDTDDDGDGILDPLDDCITTPGPAPTGCPAPPPPPAPAPNRAPTVRFRAPLAGTGIGPSFRVVLDVADDRGSPTVSVFDDDGTICVLRRAPYACTWAPTGADVGRATLLASAVDSAGLSTLGIVRVRVNRFEASLTLRQRHRKRITRVSGRLVLPAAVTRAQGCSGTVRIRLRKARRTARVTRRCTYSARLPFRPGRARVRFGGNAVIAPT